MKIVWDQFEIEKRKNREEWREFIYQTQFCEAEAF
jgi:hypothetical protein